MPEPADLGLHAVDGGVCSLSGEALSDLLAAVLARGVPFRFEARGFSMHPFIRDGDLVTISPLGGRRARHGEVAAFSDPVGGAVVVHRVVARKAGGYGIRADNAQLPDGTVAAASVFGVVTRVERRGRPVRIGLGPERVLIAALSRARMLQPLVSALRAARRPLAGRRAL